MALTLERAQPAHSPFQLFPTIGAALLAFPILMLLSQSTEVCQKRASTINVHLRCSNTFDLLESIPSMMSVQVLAIM